MTLVFVPLSPAELVEWAGSGVLPGTRAAYEATPELMEAFGITDAEEAEHVAMLAASVAALTCHGARLVAVAEAEAGSGAEVDFGEVVVRDLAWTSVQSLFAEEPGTAVPAEAVAAVQGLALEVAWDHPLVTALLSDADLLWHSREEWATLGTG